MRLLPDTHTVLWFLTGDERLSATARSQLIDDTNRVLLSAAVVWEIAIKRALGKLDAPDGYRQLLLGAGVIPLPVSLEHAEAVGPLPPHHRDPFGRLLVAQANQERAAIVTRDPIFARYDVIRVW